MKGLIIGVVLLVGVFMVGSIAMANTEPDTYPGWTESGYRVPNSYPHSFSSHTEMMSHHMAQSRALLYEKYLQVK